MERFSSLSTETIRIPVSATDDTGALVTLTGDNVKVAFKPQGEPPDNSDWLNATWDLDTSITPAIQLVSVLIGPDGGVIQLQADIWMPWVKITDSPETKVGTAAEAILIY